MVPVESPPPIPKYKPNPLLSRRSKPFFSNPNKNGKFFTFIHYRNKEDVYGAIKQFNGVQVCGIRLFVTEARKSGVTGVSIHKVVVPGSVSYKPFASVKDAVLGRNTPAIFR